MSERINLRRSAARNAAIESPRSEDLLEKVQDAGRIGFKPPECASGKARGFVQLETAICGSVQSLDLTVYLVTLCL